MTAAERKEAAPLGDAWARGPVNGLDVPDPAGSYVRVGLRPTRDEASVPRVTVRVTRLRAEDLIAELRAALGRDPDSEEPLTPAVLDGYGLSPEEQVEVHRKRADAYAEMADACARKMECASRRGAFFEAQANQLRESLDLHHRRVDPMGPSQDAPRLRRWIARKLCPEVFADAERGWFRWGLIVDLRHWCHEFPDIRDAMVWAIAKDTNRYRRSSQPTVEPHGDISDFREGLRRRRKAEALAAEVSP